MKKITIPKWAKILLCILMLLFGIGIAIHIYRATQIKTQINEQNYIASKLIEKGLCDQGSILATQNEQMQNNAISEELIVLAAGLQADYDIGELFANAYLARKEDAIISEAKSIFHNYQKMIEEFQTSDNYDYEQELRISETTHDELLILLLRVQESIPVKKNEDRLLSMVDYIADNAYDSTKMELIMNDTSLTAQKMQADYAIEYGNYQDAVTKLESVLKKNNSFQNRVTLANIVVEYGQINVSDEQIIQIGKRQDAIYQEIYEAQEQRSNEKNSLKQMRLEEKIQKLEQEIKELQEEIDRIPALKAINYIESTTSLLDKNTQAYKLELAQLYYLAGDIETAKEFLQKVLIDEDKSIEPVNLLVQNLKTFYKRMNGTEEDIFYVGNGTVVLQKTWNQLAELLNFSDSFYYGENNFYQFVLDTLNEIYNGLIIRNIDATNYPQVQVTFNAAIEREDVLEKNDLLVEELGTSLSDFKLFAASEMDITSDMLVELVVDRSGSMDGQPLLDTKKAVSNFIKNVEKNVKIGVVAFDDSAAAVAPISDNINTALQAVNGLNSGGGTSIYSGLRCAQQELDGYSGRKVIILMSDGADGSGTAIDEVLDELKRKNIYVYTIAFGGADIEYLNYIAQKCGGKCIQAASSQMLGEIYTAIGQYMVNDYIIEFSVENDKDVFERNIKIILKEENVFAEKDYDVGVSVEEIQAEIGVRPLADYFQEIGGSDMSAIE